MYLQCLYVFNNYIRHWISISAIMKLEIDIRGRLASTGVARFKLHAVALSPRKKAAQTQTPTQNWHSQLNKAVRFSGDVC